MSKLFLMCVAAAFSMFSGCGGEEQATQTDVNAAVSNLVKAFSEKTSECGISCTGKIECVGATKSDVTALNNCAASLSSTSCDCMAAPECIPPNCAIVESLCGKSKISCEQPDTCQGTLTSLCQRLVVECQFLLENCNDALSSYCPDDEASLQGCLDALTSEEACGAEELPAACAQL